ncbi:MAG: LysR family transcriptional regulator, partial [Chromatiales bacterium]|nr:LysR family transcriptional regulator [Chromatiales bacterium]
IRDAFQRLSQTISTYGGTTRELRGDALVADFERASEAVAAALVFQATNKAGDSGSIGPLPELRVGIALGEVVIADRTVTGAGVVLAQRLEQLADRGGVCISAAIREAVPDRLPVSYRDLGEHDLKGFDRRMRFYAATLESEADAPVPEPSSDAIQAEALNVLDLKALKCFLELANQMSVTNAASYLDLGEVTLLRHIEVLEEYLGSKLYENSEGDLRLTAAGERVADMDQKLFIDITRFERHSVVAEQSGDVTVNANDVAMRFLLLDVVDEFNTLHPLAKLRLRLRSLDNAIEELLHGAATLAVFPSPHVRPADLCFTPIQSYAPSLIMAKGYPMAVPATHAFEKILSSETTRRYPFVVTEDQLQSHAVERSLTMLGIEFNVGLEVGTLESMKDYVARGGAIALVSGLCIEATDYQRFDIVPVPAVYGGETSYGILQHRYRTLTAPASALCRLLGAGSEHSAHSRLQFRQLHFGLTGVVHASGSFRLPAPAGPGPRQSLAVRPPGTRRCGGATAPCGSGAGTRSEGRVPCVTAPRNAWWNAPDTRSCRRLRPSLPGPGPVPQAGLR